MTYNTDAHRRTMFAAWRDRYHPDLTREEPTEIIRSGRNFVVVDCICGESIEGPSACSGDRGRRCSVCEFREAHRESCFAGPKRREK